MYFDNHGRKNFWSATANVESLLMILPKTILLWYNQ